MSYQHYQCDDHRILSSNEEFELFQQYSQTKSPKIKNKIVEYNLKFAIKCSRAYINKYSHVDPADLTGYAMMGLIESVDKFDHTRGTKFISFAVWWIKNFIIRHVETNESMIRYPANLHRQAQEKINEKNVTDEVTLMFHNIKGGYSLNQPLSDEYNGKSFDELLESPEYFCPDSHMDDERLKAIIEDCMQDLTHEEKYIIRETFGFIVGEKRTIKSVADELNIPQEKVRYIKNASVKKIKNRLVKYLL